MFSGVVQCQAAVHCSARGAAVRTPCGTAALERTAPVFFINKNLPGVEEKNVAVSEICQAENQRPLETILENGGGENEVTNRRVGAAWHDCHAI